MVQSVSGRGKRSSKYALLEIAGMDPLGAKVTIVDVESIPVWAETAPPSYHTACQDDQAVAEKKSSTFVFDEAINKMVCLWRGDLTQLNSTAIVNTTNESMSDRSPLSEAIHLKAGSELRQEIKRSIKVCKTGDAKLTKGYNLPCRYVIHTVGPRYNIKYQTAAESALYNCYRNIMQIMREMHLASVGLCCVHSVRRSYPVEEGAHLALRTVRRFLEHFGEEMEKIIFVVTESEESVYTRLFPLYFPRSREEQEYAGLQLPDNVGNEFGEPIIKEREIRITVNPTLRRSWDGSKDGEECSDPDDENLAEEFESDVAIGRHAFAQMEADHDKARAMKLQGKQNIEADREADKRRYARIVKRAKKEDLTDIAALRCFYHSGYDKKGHPVILFVAKNFPYNHVDLEKAILYLVHIMDPLVSQRFVVIYLHTNSTRENQPAMKFLKEVYRIVDDRYKTNLHAFYVVHPTFWSRVLTWFFTTFTASTIKEKVKMVHGIEYLYSQINPDQLDIPPFALDYDLKINGARYYIPSSDITDEIGEEL